MMGRTHRSMIAIIGATRPPEHAADTASTPNRNPRFFVFHFVASFSVLTAVSFSAIPSVLTTNSGGTAVVEAAGLSFMADAR